MLLPILFMRKKQAAGGGGPFSLTGATVSGTSIGTSCGSPATATLNIAYSGNDVGVTLKIEQNHNGAGWFTLATGLTTANFPYTGIDLMKYYQKFAGDVTDVFRVTNEADAGDTVTSDTHTLTAHDCGA